MGLVKVTKPILIVTLMISGLLLIGACTSDEPVVANTASTSLGGAVVSDSAQDAVSELLGDIDANGDSDATSANLLVPGIANDDTENGVLASSVDLERNLLQVKVKGTEGRRVSMKNGGAIRLRDGLIAEIFVDPFPTHTLTAWVDLYLHDGNDAEYKDVKVQIDYDMYSMGHGPFFTIADKSPNGHYTFRLDYVMFGPWMQFLEIPDPDLPGVEYVLEVVIVAVP